MEIKVTQVKSAIGGQHNQRETLKSLGLKKLGQSVVRQDDAVTLGMIRTVAHLVTVEEVK